MNPETPRQDSLGFAVWSENLDHVRELLDAGADPDAWAADDSSDSKTPLMEAVDELEDFVDERRLAIIRMVLSAGADPNRQDSDDRTALHYAAGAGADVVRLLVEAGALVNQPSSRGRTALHEAVDRCCVGAIEALCQAGANPGAVDADGRRPADFVDDAYTDAERVHIVALLSSPLSE